MSVGSAAATAIIIGSVAAGGGAIGAAAISAHAAGEAGDATLSAAQQQVQFAREALQKQIETRAQGITTAQAAAAMSPGEIASITKILDTQGKSLAASMASLQKQQEQVDAMDPAVKAAGQGTYDLLTGKAAAILAPMQKQMDFQRNQLMSQLSSQMGPGFMTSSAGIMALTQFDNQSALSLNTAQLQALQTVGSQYGTLTGTQQSGQNAITSGTLNAFGQAQQANTAALSGYETAQQRMTSATVGAMSANPVNPFGVPNAQQSVTDSAGMPFAGAGIAGQAVGQAAGGVANIFAQYGQGQQADQRLKTLLDGLKGNNVPGAGAGTPTTLAGAGAGYNLGVNYDVGANAFK